jgi:hypothetical protein
VTRGNGTLAFFSFLARRRLTFSRLPRSPSAESVLLHPFFWNAQKRLLFICDASDRFEIMERDPPTPTLVTLEERGMEIVGDDWQKAIDRTLLDNLGKYRKYDGRSVRDLLRVLRNKVSVGVDLVSPSRSFLRCQADSFFYANRNTTTKTFRKPCARTSATFPVVSSPTSPLASRTSSSTSSAPSSSISPTKPCLLPLSGYRMRSSRCPSLPRLRFHRLRSPSSLFLFLIHLCVAVLVIRSSSLSYGPSLCNSVLLSP